MIEFSAYFNDIQNRIQIYSFMSIQIAECLSEYYEIILWINMHGNVKTQMVR